MWSHYFYTLQKSPSEADCMTERPCNFIFSSCPLLLPAPLQESLCQPPLGHWHSERGIRQSVFARSKKYLQELVMLVETRFISSSKRKIWLCNIAYMHILILFHLGRFYFASLWASCWIHHSFELTHRHPLLKRALVWVTLWFANGVTLKANTLVVILPCLIWAFENKIKVTQKVGSLQDFPLLVKITWY